MEQRQVLYFLLFFSLLAQQACLKQSYQFFLSKTHQDTKVCVCPVIDWLSKQSKVPPDQEVTKDEWIDGWINECLSDFCYQIVCSVQQLKGQKYISGL